MNIVLNMQVCELQRLNSISTQLKLKFVKKKYIISDRRGREHMCLMFLTSRNLIRPSDNKRYSLKIKVMHNMKVPNTQTPWTYGALLQISFETSVRI